METASTSFSDCKVLSLWDIYDGREDIPGKCKPRAPGKILGHLTGPWRQSWERENNRSLTVSLGLLDIAVPEVTPWISPLPADLNLVQPRVSDWLIQGLSDANTQVPSTTLDWLNSIQTKEKKGKINKSKTFSFSLSFTLNTYMAPLLMVARWVYKCVQESPFVLPLLNNLNIMFIVLIL